MEEPPQQDLQLSSLPDSVSKILNDLAENGVKSTARCTPCTQIEAAADNAQSSLCTGTTAKGLLLGFVLGGIGRASHRVMQVRTVCLPTCPDCQDTEMWSSVLGRRVHGSTARGTNGPRRSWPCSAGTRPVR